MWKLAFLLVAWLVHAPNISCGQSSGRPTPSGTESLFEKMAEEMLSFISAALSRSPTRSKRGLAFDPKVSLVDDTGVFRLQSVTPVQRLCSPAVFSKFLDIGNSTYCICTSAETEYSYASVILSIYKDRSWISIKEWAVGRAEAAAMFHYNGLLYVLAADALRDGMDLLRIDLTTGEKMLANTIPVKHPTKVSIWTMGNGNHHMAAANFIPSQESVISSQISVYEWKETYFDHYSLLQAYDVRDIEPFHIYGHSYLAVANFRRTVDQVEVDSEIFKYDLDENVWVSYQKIRTYGAMDWEFFSLGISYGQEFFLAVANAGGPGSSDSKSMIYKFVKDKFVPFQCISTLSATSVASLKTDAAFLLAVSCYNDAVYLYQYDGWRFVLTSIQYTQGAMSFGAIHLTFHNVLHQSGKTAILSVSNPHHPADLSVYEIGFAYENKLQTWHDKSSEWCLKTLTKLEENSIDSATNALNDVIFIDQPSIRIDGNIIFENGFEATKLATPHLKEIITEEVYNGSLLLKLDEFRQRLEGIDGKLQKFTEVVDHALKLDGGQSVQAPLEFQDVIFDCVKHKCQFDEIKTTFLNGEDIRDWKNQLVFLDGRQAIGGILFAEKIDAKKVTVKGLIDGLNTDNLVTKTGSHIITAKKTFKGSFTANNVEVTGLVDGIKISPDNVFLTSGHQVITGNLTFDDIATSWLEAEFVNGLDLSKLLNDIVLVDKPYSITGSKEFGDVVINDLSMTPGSTINGIDLADLWANVFWKSGSQEIKASMEFSSLSFQKNVEVTGNINGLQIPGPRVVDITDHIEITAPQVFSAPTKMSKLNVLNSLNGLSVITTLGTPPQLDIMVKFGDQVVTGHKTFQTIHLDADSYVKGTVDGVDLSELKAMVLRRNEPASSNTTWTFNNFVVNGPLTVKGRISGLDINDIFNRALLLNETMLPDMSFENLVHIQELESGDINGINIGRDLVLKNKPQSITGSKKFENIILEADSVVRGLVNNRNYSFLNDTLFTVGNQAIKSKKFNKNVKVNHITVTGSINGIPFDEFVTLTDNQTISGVRYFTNVTFQELDARSIEITGKVNNINIDQMMKNTMSYEGAQNITGKKTVKGMIHILEGDNLETNYLNGVNLEKLWNDAVLLDTPQQISGRKTFTDLVTFEDLSFQSTIDGVTEWDVKYNWMLNDVPQVIQGDVVFANGLSAENVYADLINGIDIIKLNSSIVKTNEPAIVKSPVMFGNTVYSKGDVSLSGQIQGVDISEEAVLKTGNIFLTGKRFTQDLVIDGDVSVQGLVDGVSISDLCENTLVANEEKMISRLTIKGNVVLANEVEIGGDIAGINFKNLQELAVMKNSSVIEFSGLKTFQNLTLDGAVRLKGKLGGVDLNLLNQTYMSVSRDQDIQAPMDFDEVSVTGIMAAKDFTTADGRISGIDIRSLNERVLKNDETQIINASYYFDEVVFLDDLFVAGKVNGLAIPSGLMRKNHANYIQSPKIFNEVLTVLGDLHMDEGKTVQNVDVSKWKEMAVMKDGGSFNVAGTKTFNDLVINDARIEGLVDGLKISDESLLMTYGDQTVTGMKTVIGDVEIKGSLTVSGLVNGTNFDELRSTTLQRNRNNTVTGLKYFSQPLVINSLQAQTVSGIDIVQLQSKVHRTFDATDLQNRLDELEGVVTNMQEAFANQAIVFQYYETFQVFAVPTAYKWKYVAGEDVSELLLLADYSSSKASCTSIRFFSFSHMDESFVPIASEITASHAVSMQSVFAWSRTYLFIANKGPGFHCSNMENLEGTENSAGDVYIWRDNRFEQFQVLRLAPAVDMVAFYDGALLCMVYIEIQNVNVYCSSGKEEKFVKFETLRTKGGRKASIVKFGNMIALAIIAEDVFSPRQYYAENRRSLEIYFWNSEKATFSDPVQTLLATYAQSVLFIPQADEYGSQLFLAVAEGSIPKIHNEPKIKVYRYDVLNYQPFQMYHGLDDYGELEYITLSTKEVLLYVLNSRNERVNIYQYKGASGFVKIDSIIAIGSVHIHPFIRQDPADRINHYVALVGPHAAMAQPTQGTDYAKVLKSKMKGNIPFLN